MASLREAKEAFVSGHSGGSLQEVSVIAATPALLLLALRLLQPRSPQANWQQWALEYGVLVLPLVSQLLGPPTPAAVAAGAAGCALCLWLLHQGTQRQAVAGPTPSGVSSFPLAPLREALSAYRASLMVLTCVAILGVDFPAFPRRFAKAQTFGTGLMDAGVGSIVAASALAQGLRAAEASAVACSSSSSKAGSMQRELLRVAALASLGFGRVLATGAVDYQTHVGEYGTHWNFFLTLAALRTLGLLLGRRVASSGPACGVLGVAVLAAHQYALSAAGLIEYMHAEERGPGLLAANKEGILSLPGYWALHLLGVAIGHAAGQLGTVAAARQHGRHTQAAKWTQPRAAWRGAGLLAAGAVAAWLCYWAAVTGLQPVSRRAANAPYVLWMLALNLQCAALCAAVQATRPAPLPALLHAFNARMLPVFLAANLLTGLVNLSMLTLAAGAWTARAVVAAYMAAICLCAALLV